MGLLVHTLAGIDSKEVTILWISRSLGVERHLWSSDSRPAYRGIRTFRSPKPVPRCTVVRADGGRLLTEKSEVKARWTAYFERLYQADPPVVELDVKRVTIPIADPPIIYGNTGCGEPVEM